MADEALDCFLSLIKSVPEWKAELENISQSVAERQKEIILENQPPDETEESPVQIQRKASKSSSLKSRRGEDENDKPVPTETEPPTVQEQVPHMTESDALRLSQRKRKTASVCSRQTGPVKYRSRSMVVVYYDGEIQKRFEALVRAIGVFRNTLRKGKMSAKMDLFSRTGSSGSEDSFDEELSSIPKIKSYASRSRKPPVLTKNDGTEIFDKADSFLDKAQTLCERAAHQTLRDGDCALEVNNAKEHFSSAQNVSESELPVLRKRAERAAERRRREEERRKLEDKDGDKDAEVHNSSNEKIPFGFGSPASLELEVDDIEADNSEADDNDAPMPVVNPFKFDKVKVHSAARLSNRLSEV